MKILKCNALLSVIYAIVMSVIFIKDATMWWIPIASFFSAYICLYFAVWIFFAIVSKLPLGSKEGKVSKIHAYLLNVGYAYICSTVRIKMVCHGIEKIPKDRRFILVSNHRSNFDNMVQSYYLRNFDLAYISKSSNFKIPIGKGYIKRCLYLSLVRGNPMEALKIIDKATEYVKNDVTSIGVFPEGTRSKCKKMGEFKMGYLRVAYNTRSPIVVSSIIGTEKVHKNFPFKRTVVEYEILDVIEPEIYSPMCPKELSDKIKGIIADNLIKKGEIENDAHSLQPTK